MTEQATPVDTQVARMKLEAVAEIERDEGAKKLRVHLQKLQEFLNTPDNKVTPAELTAVIGFGNFLAALVPPLGTDQEREAEITEKLAETFTRTSHQINHLTLNRILMDMYQTLRAEVVIYGGYVQANELGEQLMTVAAAVRERKEEEFVQPPKPSLISRVTRRLLGT